MEGIVESHIILHVTVNERGFLFVFVATLKKIGMLLLLFVGLTFQIAIVTH